MPEQLPLQQDAFELRIWLRARLSFWFGFPSWFRVELRVFNHRGQHLRVLRVKLANETLGSQKQPGILSVRTQDGSDF